MLNPDEVAIEFTNGSRIVAADAKESEKIRGSENILDWIYWDFFSNLPMGSS